MAHNAKLAELTARLIDSITGDRGNEIRTKKALRALKEHNFARTNQFAVKSKLDGLTEKFVILGREELGDALESRLAGLSTHDKLLPDKLALLLALSDRPHEKVSSSTVLALEERDKLPPPELLTWEDIIRDDPLDEPDLWKNIERGYHSSGDEDNSFTDQGSSPASTAATETGIETVARTYLVGVEDVSFTTWKNESKGLTEYGLCRESLLMLQGLPSPIYEIISDGHVKPQTDSPALFAPRTSPSLDAVLVDLAAIGSKLNSLRIWSLSVQEHAYIRTAQSEVKSLLHDFALHLSTLEMQNSASKHSIVSLLGLLSQVRLRVQPLLEFARVLGHVQQQKTVKQPYRLLDFLYEALRISHAIGHPSGELSKLFTAMLRTYLRPVAAWCSDGRLKYQESAFFIIDQNRNCANAEVWSSRFRLLDQEEQNTIVPTFMEKHIRIIYKNGKQRMLDNLLLGNANKTLPGVMTEIDLVRMHLYLAEYATADFDHVFHNTLSAWIADCCANRYLSLPAHLVENYDLLTALRVYHDLLLAGNSALFNDVSRSLHSMLSRPAMQSISASVVLTEHLRGAVTTTDYIEPAKLSIAVNDTSGIAENNQLAPQSDRVVNAHATDYLSVDYAVSWPLQSIFGVSVKQSYSRIFALILQAQRAKHLLQVNIPAMRLLMLQTHQIAELLRLRFTLLTTVDVIVYHITATCQALHCQTEKRLLQADNMDTMIECWHNHCQRLVTASLLSPALIAVHEDLLVLFEICEKTGGLWRSASHRKSNTPVPHGLPQLTVKHRAILESMVEKLRAFIRVEPQHEELGGLADRLEFCIVDPKP